MRAAGFKPLLDHAGRFPDGFTSQSFHVFHREGWNVAIYVRMIDLDPRLDVSTLWYRHA